jgi:hypothetical protein
MRLSRGVREGKDGANAMNSNLIKKIREMSEAKERLFPLTESVQPQPIRRPV